MGNSLLLNLILKTSKFVQSWMPDELLNGGKFGYPG